MPLLRCLAPDCGHQWFEASRLAEGAECIECGGPATVVEGDEEDEQQDTRTDERKSATERPRIAYSREAARALLRKHKIGEPPVPVRRIAALEGLELQGTTSLGEGIRARLVGDIIEVAGGDPDRRDTGCLM